MNSFFFSQYFLQKSEIMTKNYTQIFRWFLSLYVIISLVLLCVRYHPGINFVIFINILKSSKEREGPCWPSSGPVEKRSISGRETRNVWSSRPGLWWDTVSRHGLWSPTRAPATPGPGTWWRPPPGSSLAPSTITRASSPPAPPPVKCPG